MPRTLPIAGLTVGLLVAMGCGVPPMPATRLTSPMAVATAPAAPDDPIVGLYPQGARPTALVGRPDPWTLTETARIAMFGGSFVVGTSEGLVRRFDASARPNGTLPVGHRRPVRCVGGNGGVVVSIDDSNVVYAFDGTRARRLRWLSDGRCHQLAVAPDGKRFATVNEEGAGRLWSLDDAPRSLDPEDTLGELSALTWGDDGSLAAHVTGSYRPDLDESLDAQVVKWAPGSATPIPTGLGGRPIFQGSSLRGMDLLDGQMQVWAGSKHSTTTATVTAGHRWWTPLPSGTGAIVAHDATIRRIDTAGRTMWQIDDVELDAGMGDPTWLTGALLAAPVRLGAAIIDVVEGRLIHKPGTWMRGPATCTPSGSRCLVATEGEVLVWTRDEPETWAIPHYSDSLVVDDRGHVAWGYRREDHHLWRVDLQTRTTSFEVARPSVGSLIAHRADALFALGDDDVEGEEALLRIDARTGDVRDRWRMPESVVDVAIAPSGTRVALGTYAAVVACDLETIESVALANPSAVEASKRQRLVGWIGEGIVVEERERAGLALLDPDTLETRRSLPSRIERHWVPEGLSLDQRWAIATDSTGIELTELSTGHRRRPLVPCASPWMITAEHLLCLRDSHAELWPLDSWPNEPASPVRLPPPGEAGLAGRPLSEDVFLAFDDGHLSVTFDAWTRRRGDDTVLATRPLQKRAGAMRVPTQLPNGDLVGVRRDGVWVFDAHSLEPTRRLHDVSASDADAIHVSRDGQIIALNLDHRVVVATNAVPRGIEVSSDRFINTIALRPDGRRLVTFGNGDNVARIWRVDERRVQRIRTFVLGDITQAEFIDDQRLAFSVNGDAIGVIDLDTGDRWVTQLHHRGFAVLRAPRLLALAGSNEHLFLDWDDGVLRARSGPGAGRDLSITTARDHRLFGSAEGEPRMWDVAWLDDVRQGP